MPSALGLGLAAVLTACGSGQITQTDTQSAAVNGASAHIGAISISDAQLAYPRGGVYQPGSSAELIVTISDNGVTDDTLVRVSSPAATAADIDGSPTGTRTIPGGFAVKSGIDPDDLTAPPTSGGPATQTPASNPPSEGPLPTGSASASASGSASASASGSASASALPPGKVTIMLTGLKSINGDSLRAGLTIPITFYFAHAGQVTIAEVPISAPSSAQTSTAASSNNG